MEQSQQNYNNQGTQQLQQNQWEDKSNIKKLIEMAKEVDGLKETINELIIKEEEKRVHEENAKRLDDTIKKWIQKIKQDIAKAINNLGN